MGDMDLSTLADSLINVKLDVSGDDTPGCHSLALARNRLTSAKQAKLRGLLDQHQLMHVCPAKLPHTDVSSFLVAEAKPGGISSGQPILNKSSSMGPKEKFFMFGSEATPSQKTSSFSFTKTTPSPEKLDLTGSGPTFTNVSAYSVFSSCSSSNTFGEVANKQSKSGSFSNKNLLKFGVVPQALTDTSGFTFQPSNTSPYSTFSTSTASHSTLLGQGSFSNKSPLMSLDSIVAGIGDDNTITKDLSAATASGKTSNISNLVPNFNPTCTTAEVAGRIRIIDGKSSFPLSLNTNTLQASSSIGSFNVTPPLTPKSGNSPETVSPVQDKEHMIASSPISKVDNLNVSSSTIAASGSKVLPVSSVFGNVGTSASTISGSPSTTGTSSSILGDASASGNLTSIFGGTKTILEGSNSGAIPTTSTSTSRSIFGGTSSTTTTTSSLFGSRTTTTTTATTATITTVTTGSIFGGATTTSDSSFGGAKATGTIFGNSNPTGSIFVGTSTMSTTGSILGETNAATTTSSNMIGGHNPTGSIFGGTSISTPGSMFGGSSAATETSSSTIFGSSNPSVSIFGSFNPTGSIFGVTSTTVSMPIFGGTNAPATGTSIFGGSNSSGTIFEKTNADTTASIINPITAATSGVLDSVSTGSASSLDITLNSSSAIIPTAASLTTSISGGSTSTVPTTSVNPTTSLLGLSTPVLELTIEKSNSEAQLAQPELENPKPITSLSGESPITSEATSSELISRTSFNLTQLTSNMLSSSLQPAASSSEVKLTSLFGNSTIGDAKPASLFGGSNTTEAKPASIFGGSSTTEAKSTSIFGSSTAAEPNKASPFGGSTPSDAKQPSIFGGSTPSDAKQPSIFGGSTPSDAKQPSIFGGSAPSDAKQSSIFGGVSTSDVKQPSLFGSPTISTGIGFSFGNSTPTQDSSAFGVKSLSLFTSPTTTASSNSFFGQPICSPSFGGGLFGQPGGDANAQGTPVFGSKLTFSQSATPFGQSSTFGAAGSTSIFGGGTTAAFGAGGNAFQSSGSSFFGSGNSSGGSAGAFSSGQSINQSGFGSSTSFNAKPGGFGLSPVFERGASSGFGGVPTFGGTPGFGGVSTFGGSPNKLFGTTAPSSPGFGSASPTQESSATFANLATQNTMTFGNLAQNQSPAFGSPNQSLFGAGSQSAPEKPAFSSVPGGGVGFGGSSFSSWR